MIKKILLISILVITLGLAGFGCKGLSAEEQSAVKPITLKYWTVYDDVKQLEQFAAEYKQQRSYVNIEVRQVRYDEFDSLFTNALADDVAPDIISIHNRWIPQYQSNVRAYEFRTARVISCQRVGHG